jgi:hypothetical protein
MFLLYAVVPGLVRAAAEHRVLRGKLRGEFGALTTAPIHTRALFTYKNGHRSMGTCWRQACAIRTYKPGICWRCRDETAHDLIEPDKVEKS